VVVEAVREGIRPDPDLTITEWADEYRYLPKKSSSESGKYRSSRTPYLREIMDALSPSSPCQEVSVMKGTQLGFTEVGNNWFCFVADMCPGPMMMIFPTLDLAKGHSQQKLIPTVDETPRLHGKIRESRSRDSGNTIFSKDFPGGTLFLGGSNSAAAFRSKSIRFLFLDDIDGFELDVGGEGDPIDLAEKRTDTFSTRKKIFKVSTPTTRNISRIARCFEESDQRHYHVPCPHCGEKQLLEFGTKDDPHGVKFSRNANNEVIKAWYVCRFCGEQIDEHEKTYMLAHGEWIPAYPGRHRRGYHLSSLYSPLGWVSWAQICQEFLAAKNYKERLKAWINTRLGLPFEEKGDQPDWVLLKNRKESYKMLTVPAGGEILTASVDVQEDRLEVKIKAWGNYEESWLIYYGPIFGDTEKRDVWDQLDIILNRSYPRTDGRDLRISIMAVDAGYRTQTVYNYCRFRKPRVIAVKGSSQANKRIISPPTDQDVTWMGTTIKGGANLWIIGTNMAKETIYSRIQLTDAGTSGVMHFPEDIQDEYFMQLTAEKLVTKFDARGFPRTEWVKVSERNEALDLEVYAYAAAHVAGVPYMDFIKSSVAGNQPGAQPTNARRTISPGAGSPDARERIRDFKRPVWMDR
jgi:phage terminase large subunit GpA-like protein